MTGERVAVLGGGGKTGRAVALALSGAGADPVALGRVERHSGRGFDLDAEWLLDFAADSAVW